MLSVSSKHDAESAANALARCRRLLVIGCPGAGKSRLSKELARRIELPLLHLDDAYWSGDGMSMPPNEWDQFLADQLMADAWILDGNYLRTLSRRLERADGVVFLDYPRSTCLRGAITRNRRGNPSERRPWWDLSLMARIWGFARTDRPRVLDLLRSAPAECAVVQLVSRRQGSVLLDELGGKTNR